MKIRSYLNKQLSRQKLSKYIKLSDSLTYIKYGRTISFDENNPDQLDNLRKDLTEILRYYHASNTLIFKLNHYLWSVSIEKRIYNVISPEQLRKQNIRLAEGCIIYTGYIPIRVMIYKGKNYRVPLNTAKKYSLGITEFRFGKSLYIKDVFCFGKHPNCDPDGYFCTEIKDMNLSFPEDIRSLKGVLECANLDESFSRNDYFDFIKKLIKGSEVFYADGAP